MCFAITFSDLKAWPMWGDPNKKRFDQNNNKIFMYLPLSLFITLTNLPCYFLTYLPK